MEGRISAQVIMSLNSELTGEESTDVIFATDNIKLTHITEDVMVLNVNNGIGVNISITFTKEK